MKQFIFAFLFFTIFGLTAFAQTPSLPANIAQWGGEDSYKVLNNRAIKARLKKLMGKKEYRGFMETFETVNPVERRGNFLFSSGCLIHACGHLESAIVIDLVNRTLHTAVFRETVKTKYFNEKGRPTPRIIKNWADRLTQK
jgi:hypothetical protein